MKKEILVEGLNKKEKDDLLKSISDFEEWLLKKKIIDTNPDKIRIVDLPFANADWIMKYDENNKTVSFNTFVQKKCSYDYYKSIVLHEFFHLAVQKVPNKEDAVRIKDDFGNELMKLIDIEADFFTALFYKEHLKFGLVDYLKLYYEGSQAFSDQWIRIGKLERFMGTLLGIIKMFITHVDNISGDINSYDLYLLSISPLYTEENMHVLVIRKEHIYFDLINASQKDFIDIKDCYTNIDSLTFKGYAEKIINFVCKALKLTLPQKIKNDINSISK